MGVCTYLLPGGTVGSSRYPVAPLPSATYCPMMQSLGLMGVMQRITRTFSSLKGGMQGGGKRFHLVRARVWVVQRVSPPLSLTHTHREGHT